MGIEDNKKEATARGTVARGRTVMVPHPTEKKVIGQHPMTGEPIMGPVMREYGPDSEITLAAGEIVRLRTAGFLVDPNRIINEVSAEGPSVTEHQHA